MTLAQTDWNEPEMSIKTDQTGRYVTVSDYCAITRVNF